MFDKDEILPNHENSANQVIKCVPRRGYRTTRRKMTSNVIDSDIGHFDNKTDMTGMKSLDETKVDNTRPLLMIPV